MKLSRSTMRWSLAAIAASALAACGGGGSDGISEVSNLSVSGIAARGAALEGASVQVQCKTGTGNGTTASGATAGSYTVTVTNGSGPCLVTVTSGTIVLRSLATSFDANGNAIANVTPLSEAIIEALYATKGATSNINFLTTAAPTASDITAATNATIAAINSALGTSAIAAGTNLLSNPSFVIGDTVDQALDNLNLDSNGTIADIIQNGITSTTDISVNPNGATGSTGSTGSTGATGGSTT